MVNEDAKKVWAYIDEHEQEYIDLLKKYCCTAQCLGTELGNA